jgi:hypothetical protein
MVLAVGADLWTGSQIAACVQAGNSSFGGQSIASGGSVPATASCGGPRGGFDGETSLATPRCFRMPSIVDLRITTAITRMRPGQRGHASASIRKTRLRSSAQGVHLLGAGAGAFRETSAQTGRFRGTAGAGTTCDRHPAAGASTPWYRVTPRMRAGGGLSPMIRRSGLPRRGPVAASRVIDAFAQAASAEAQAEPGDPGRRHRPARSSESGR